MKVNGFSSRSSVCNLVFRVMPIGSAMDLRHEFVLVIVLCIEPATPNVLRAPLKMKDGSQY